MQSKAIWKSKTFWVNVLVLLSSLLPDVQSFLTANFGAEGAVAVIGALMGVLNLILRYLTVQAVRLR